MAVRLKITHTAIAHTPDVPLTFTLEIHDTQLGVDANIDFNGRPPGPRLTYDQDVEDIFYPIRSSTLSFSMTIENTDHEDFLDDYVNADEGRFLVKYQMDRQFGDPEVLFIGRLIHDETTITYRNNPELSLKAVDPFLDLEHIEYDVSTYPQKWIRTTLNYILNLSPTVQYFFPNDADEILHIYNGWKDTLHASIDDVYSNTYMQNYFSKEEDGQIKRKKAVYVLGEMMRSQGARIYFEDGQFIIEQIEQRIAASVRYDRYSVDETFLGSVTTIHDDFDFETTNWEANPNPEIRFFPPVNSVRLFQNGNYVENLLFEYKFAYNITPSGPHTISTVTELIDQKVYCRLIVNPYIETSTSFVIGYIKYAYFVFDVKIKIGGRYLKGKGGIYQNGATQGLTLKLTDTEWTIISSDVVRVYMPAYVYYTDIQNNAKDFFYTIDIISPILLETGDVEFDFTYVNAYTDIALSQTITAPQLPTPSSNKWIVNSNSIALLKDIQDGSENQGVTITTLVNSTNNSKIYDVEYDMGSFPDGTSLQRLRVNDVNTESEEWVHPDFGNMPFQEMAIQTIRSIYAKAKRILTMEMRGAKAFPGIVKMRHRMTYKGILYIPMTLDCIHQSQETLVTWFGIAADTVAVDPPVVAIPYTPIVPGGLLGPVITTSNLQGNDSGGNPSGDFTKVITSLSGTSTSLSDYESFPDPSIVTMDSINASWDIYIGSSHYTCVDVANQDDLRTGQYKLDFTNKEILWPRDMTGKRALIKITDKYIIDTTSQTN